LDRGGCGTERLCGLLETKIVQVEFSFADEALETLHLMRRYQDLPMSFADACLVRMAERFPDASVFTTDSDFRIYRKNGRSVIPLIIPD
jgi:predicted nucleic acid-binding protein